MHPFSASAPLAHMPLLAVALALKGCNFIIPIELVQQFPNYSGLLTKQNCYFFHEIPIPHKNWEIMDPVGLVPTIIPPNRHLSSEGKIGEIGTLRIFET